MKQKKIFALGFFDGVHLGHQALLHACCALAQSNDAIPCAVTFDLPPSAVLQNKQPNMLNTETDRKNLLMQYGMAEILLFPATKENLSMPWQDFLTMLIAQDAAGFVCGEDYRFGHSGEGNSEKLFAFAKERSLPCIVVPALTMDGEKISSTRIRALLEVGKVAEANRLLGHPHVLTGTVVSGRKLGRTIGIPTANLQLPDALLTPKFGVYACEAFVDGNRYLAVTNIGTRPTVNGHHVTVEPWLLDFYGDLYGKTLTLHFHEFLRPEQKFENLDALRTEILKNEAQVRKIFEKT